MIARAPADSDDSGDFLRVREIFESALERPPQERMAFVEAACGGNATLLAAVQEMLRADAEPHRLLDSGPGEHADRWRPGDIFAGHYRIATLLGRGGMGEVYRAHDATLGRDVALKLLPSAIPGAAEGERLSRFQREAQVLAALNHPNIGAIHGVAEADGVRALVLELVEGPTLAERIAAGPLPIAETLSVARQIATGLEAAHEQGIVHRDLKPANVKLRPDGTVKLLDFGLAKMMQPEGAAPGTPHSSPIITTPSLVLRGVLLGTAAYASPEQAKGRDADRRSDVWAFGAVLYEMLSGERAFKGADVPETIAAVLRADVDLSRLPAATPAPLRHLLSRSLERDVTRRLRDIGEARILLDDLAGGRSATAPIESTTVATRSVWRRVLPLAAATAAGGAAVGALLWRPAPQPPPVTRLTLSIPAEASLLLDPQSRDLTISPDGTRVVYKGGPGADRTRLFVYALDQLEPKPLTNSGMPKGPFISSDGQWVGFFEPGGGAGGVGAVLKKIAMAGGPPLTTSRLDGPSRGAVWGESDIIIAASGTPATGLLRIPAGGGELSVLTRPDRNAGERDHLWPQLLPGGKTVLFTVTSLNGGIDAARIAALDLASGRWRTLLEGASQAQYVPSGHVVYVAGGALWAVAFDVRRVETLGTPTVVVPSVVILSTETAEFDVARDGTLVYVAHGGADDRPRTLVWVDRSGRESSIAAPPRAYANVRLSPDGSRVAVQIDDQGHDIWVLDLARETLTPVTTDPGQDESPVWTADGRRIIFSSQAGGTLGSLFWRAADGTGVAEPLMASESSQRPTDVLPDGTRVLFSQPNGLMTLSLDDKRSVVPVLPEGSAPVGAGDVSPDGRWLAYVTPVAGTPQVFVSALSDPGGARSQVTPAGGSQPRWSRDGRELFYTALDGSLMSVPVSGGSTFAWGTPTKLFANEFYVGRGIASRGGTYDVSPDGQRFLMIKTTGGPGPLPEQPTVVVVKNWGEELKRLLPLKR